MIRFLPRLNRKPKLQPGLNATLRVLALVTSACLVSTGAPAEPVATYITVQPIDVCTTATSGCALINSRGGTYLNGPNTPIGFFDSSANIATSGMNITRNIFASQIGVDVTFLPVAQYVSTNFINIQVDSCDPSGSPCQSMQAQQLSDQPAIKNLNMPSPTPPLSSNGSTINLFFVNKITPPSGLTGTDLGIGWINNNGVVIGQASLVGGFASPDTIAHEIGHNLALDHTTFGAGVDGNNVLDAGNFPRAIPSPGFLPSPPAPVPGIPTWTTQVSPTGTASPLLDQLTLGSCASLDTCTNQQGAALLSGFANPKSLVTDTIGGTQPTMMAVTRAALSQGDPTTFHVAFDPRTMINLDGNEFLNGRPGDFLLKLTLTAPPGSFFEPGTFFVTNANLAPGGTVSGTISPDGTQLELDFSRTAFIRGSSLDYTIGVCSLLSGICVDGDPSVLLDGGTYAYEFETDPPSITTPVELFLTTSDLVSCGEGCGLISDSWDPDLRIPSEVLNPDTFVGFSQFPCTPIDGQCPALVLADGSDTVEETPVPEPSSILVLLGALAALCLACRVPPLRSAVIWSRPARRRIGPVRFP